MSWWRSLRVRLTAGFVAVAAVTIGVGAAAIVLLVEQVTLGELDTTLFEEATTLATLIDLPGAHLDESVRAIGRETDAGGRKFIRVVRADGTTVVTWRRVPRVVARRGLLKEGAGVFSVGEDEAQYRVAIARTPQGAVLVGAHVSRQVDLVQGARWAVALLAAVLLTVLGISAWAFTGRATREIDRLAAEVATIEAGTLERRLTRRETVEVDALVTVLNRLLGRLERSVGQMRRFSADAAHELRTPLAALRVRLEVGLRRGGETVPREVVVDALEQAERLGRLAEDLLTLARLEGGVATAFVLDGRVHVDALVDEVGCALQPIAGEEGRAFRWAAEPGLVVRGSEPLLKRVLLNLVDNAFRHTPSTAAVALDAVRDEERVVVVVRDAGPGIAPDLVRDAFERFRHGAGGGTGLGLALAREIVECHLGSVALETAETGGLVVRVVLPLAPEAIRPVSTRLGASS